MCCVREDVVEKRIHRKFWWNDFFHSDTIFWKTLNFDGKSPDLGYQYSAGIHKITPTQEYSALHPEGFHLWTKPLPNQINLAVVVRREHFRAGGFIFMPPHTGILARDVAIFSQIKITKKSWNEWSRKAAVEMERLSIAQANEEARW